MHCKYINCKIVCQAPKKNIYTMHFFHQNNISIRFYQILCPQGIKKERRFLRTPPTIFLAPSGNITGMSFNDNLFYTVPIDLLLVVSRSNIYKAIHTTDTKNFNNVIKTSAAIRVAIIFVEQASFKAYISNSLFYIINSCRFFNWINILMVENPITRIKIWHNPKDRYS